MAVKERRSGRALRGALRSPGRPPVARRADLVRLEGGDRDGAHERGRGAGGGPISPCRGPVVPEVRRHATHASVRPGQAAVGAPSVVLRARGDRAAARSRPRRARHRPAPRPRALHHLARASAQRGHPPRRPRVPCHDRAVARRSCRAPTQSIESSRATRRCAAPWRTAWRAGSRGRTAPRCPARRSLGRSADRSGANTGGGGEPGALSRSRPGSRSSSPRTRPCASRTRRSDLSLYVQGRGGLRRELSACLRSGRARAGSPVPAPADGANPSRRRSS